MRIKRILLITLVSLLLFGVTVSIVANVLVNRSAEGLCYSSTDDMPYRRVALLLGTTRLGRTGKPNPYFNNRIAACAELYRAGKVGKVLVSGDNSRKGYNEPEDMRRQAGLRAGQPHRHIAAVAQQTCTLHRQPYWCRRRGLQCRRHRYPCHQTAAGSPRMAGTHQDGLRLALYA